MGDGNVRLVRCPKCENVLPELPDYSVYRCGGCGAVLRAKMGKSEVDSPSDKYDGERAGGVIEKFGKEIVDPSVASGALIKPTGGSSFRYDERNSENDDVQDNAEKCGNVPNFTVEDCVAENGFDMSVNRGSETDDFGNNDKECGNISKFTVDKLVGENDFDVNMNRGEVGIMHMGTKVAELKSRVENESGSQRTMADRQLGDRVEKPRFSTPNCIDEGSFNCHSFPPDGYREPLRNPDNPAARNRLEFLKQDRAELLRKLDELKDQLGRSCDVTEIPQEKIPQERMTHSCAPNKHVTEPCYFNHYPDPRPFTNRPLPDMAAHSFYPSMHTSKPVPVYGDPYGSQVPCHYQKPSHMYFSGQCIDPDLNPHSPYPSNAILRQSSCSCFHCYGEHHNKSFPDFPNNPMIYPYEKSVALGPQVYNSRSANPPLTPHNPHVRCPTVANPNMSGFARSRPQTVAVANGGRHCHPIAGGAPFITCRKCSELVQLPKEILLMEKKRQKVRCGACSEINTLTFISKKIVVTPQTDTKQAPSSVNDDSNEVVKSTSHTRGHLNRGSINMYSDDSGYEFQSMDREPIVSSSTGQGFDSGKSQDMQSIHSSSLSSFGDEEFPDGLIVRRENTNCEELVVKPTSSPPLPCSTQRENFDASSNNHSVNRSGKGNQSARSDQEKMMPNKTTSRQNSLKDVHSATEMDVSFNDYPNTVTSRGSADIDREDQLRTNKGSDSFFTGIIKKSFRDLPRSNQKVNITVNGHPIPDRVVKKAEKVAGRILPGQYWYDSRAGFWGVMGGPCLGIIPPFIEEFNYPMPENCAGGSTSVFVNGRELHKKDLDLLASRGLRNDRDRSYIIEITGRVLDEDSGEELDSLGKLAPTVEKLRHGFGMKVPRTAR